MEENGGGGACGGSWGEPLGDDQLKSPLSREGRRTMLEMRKVEEPFKGEVQRVRKDNVDLPELSLMLAGATRIYTSQVDALMKEVQALQEHCCRTKTAWESKKKKKKEAEEGVVVPPELSPVVLLRRLKLDDVPNGMVVPDSSVVQGKESIVATMELEPTESVGDAEQEEATNADADASGGVESMVVVIPDEEMMEVDKDGPASAAPAALTPVVIPPFLETSNDVGVDGEPVAKKKKRCNGLVSPPPHLLSCFEELEILMAEGVFNDRETNHVLPPSLSKAFRSAQRKVYLDDWGPKQVQPKEKHSNSTNTQVPVAIGPPPAAAGVGPELEPDFSSSVEIKPDIASTISTIFPAATAASFSSEDQAAIQKCINQLHYLPFKFDLTKEELAQSFSKTVEKLRQIFKKNNVEVSRDIVKTVKPRASSLESLEKQKNHGNLPPPSHNLSDIYNALVSGCRKECETFIHNATVSIFERAKEKTFAESRENIKQMIMELQRNIVPKFARVPLMAENTPEFFQQVHNFECRMKKILEDEAKKEEFDVRKYEREVLEVTSKESLELERLDDFSAPTSPCKTTDTVERLFPSPSTRSSFDSSFSSCGSTWVPFKHIFNHLKSNDRTEAARSFYAVLALLSYQNLDINYDQLYSEESAVFIHRQLSKDDELDSKFQRGVKIATSRCPDADKDELFVAALTSESRDEAFRHLLAQETRDIALQDGTSQEEPDEGIAEAMADFVEEESTAFTGKLHGRRRQSKRT